MGRTFALQVASLLAVGFTFIPPAAAQYDDFSRQRNLGIIADYADRICSHVEMSGSSSSYEANAAVNAELKGLARTLAQGGVTIGGRRAGEQYQNVDRSQLVDVLKNNTDCRLRTSERLIDIYFKPPPSPNYPAAPQQSYVPQNAFPPAAQGSGMFQPQQKPWQNTGDPRQIAAACQQGSREACVALARYAQAGCQMGKPDDCSLANNMAGLGYR